MKTTKQLWMGLVAAVGFSTAATAATTPIVTVDGDTVTVQNTTNSAGGFNWNILGVAGKLCVPAAENLAAGSYVKVRSLQFWSERDSGANQYADRVCLKANGLTYTSGLYAGSTAQNGVLTYSFAVGQEPIVAVGTTNDVSFVLASGKTGLRFRAGEKGSGSDGFFQVGGNTDYAPQLVLTAEKTTEVPVPYKSVLSLNFGASDYNVSANVDPGAVVSDSNWHNLNGNNVTNAEAGTAFVTYGGSGTYRNEGKTPAYLKGYLDDNGKTVDITVTNLTGKAYDLYIYCNSDNATAWSSKTINGTAYSATASGEGTTGSAAWGNNTPAVSVLGSNVMVVRSVVPGEDGKIAISSSRVGDTATRGTVAAIQLGEVEQVIAKEYAATVGADTTWTRAEWNPALPDKGMPADAVATVTVQGTPKLTLDGTISVGKLVIVSAEQNMLTIKKAADANTSFAGLDVSGAADGTTWDSKEGFTACHALLDSARTVNNKFYFLGENGNGATLDYGTAQNNYTFSGHYVFNGGVHTFQNCSESAALQFGANATVENPTFWVQGAGTVLNFKSRNPCGWNASASDAGIVRIGNGAKVVAQKSANGTWYWSQQFYLENGATFEIGTEGDNFRTVGNDSRKPHFRVPEGASAAITGGTNNFFALPSNSGGAAVFDVGANAMLTLSASLKTLDNNGKPFIKCGAGTLKVTGNVSAFNAAIQVKEGTLEAASATALGNNATVKVETDATLKLVAEEDRTFAKAVSGQGNVVKAGAGTLGVTPGQFGDNRVSIAGGKLQFAITHEQAASGVALCKAGSDISASVTVVNAAGETVEGDFTFEEGVLSFKANCVDFVLDLEANAQVNWSSLEGWIDSPESTIVIFSTNGSSQVDFDQAVTAKSFKVVSLAEKAVTIPYAGFVSLAVGSFDFTEALGGVKIDFSGAASAEIVLKGGVTIAGSENVTAVNAPEGTGFYKDATQLWLCKTIGDVTRTSPTTGDMQAFTNFFVGTASGDWTDKANWRTAQNGLLVPYQYAYYPQQNGGNFTAWYPACFDGDVINAFSGEKKISCALVEGWKTALDFRNGVDVTIHHMNKFADWFMWIDGTSSVAIDGLGGSSFQYGYVFNVAGNLTIGAFVGGIENIPYTYNLGKNATVTYTNGVRYGTHTVSGGKLVAEAAGLAAAVTVAGDVAISTPAITAAFTVSEDSTLTLTSTAEGDLAIAGNWTNNGTLDVAAGTVVFKPGVTAGNVTTSGTGKVFYGFTVDINNCGTFTPPTGYTVDNVKIFDVGGNLVPSTVVGDHLEYVWNVEGKNCWWDYGFDGNLASVGTDTTTMSAEGTPPYYNEGNTALCVGRGTPYRGATYPEQFTAVFFGKVVSTAKQMEIGFGSTTGGTKYGVVFACGDPAQNEVQLLVTSGYGVLKTISMKVPNAYDANHLYAFSCQTVSDGTDRTKVSVFLDGKLLQSYTFDGKITLGSGFQIGSVHGGNLGGGYTKATSANTNAELDFLRVYQTVLTDEAMTKYAEKYPYVSANGKATRELDDALDQTWVAASFDAAWSQTFGGETYATNCPLPTTMVELTVSAAAEVEMNLAEVATYETLSIEGAAATFKTGTDAVTPTVAGLTSIGADVTVDYNAFSFGNVDVAGGKTFTFDFANFPFTNYFADATIAFTGFVTGEGEVRATGLPGTGARTAAFEQNESTGQYELKITVSADTPFVYDGVAWTWNGEAVDAATVQAQTAIPVVKNGTDALEMASATSGRSYTVNGGTLRFATVADNASPRLTVNAGGTFDMNGKPNPNYTVVLNGGALVNNGADISVTQRQFASITVSAGAQGSSVGGTGNFTYTSSQYGANVLDLGGGTLVKDGTNVFSLCNTTVTNGTLKVAEGTLRIEMQASRFAADATLELAGGTLALANGQGLTVASVTGDGGTIANAGAFNGAWTLTGSVTLSGGGSFNTVTLADGSTLTASVGVRGLALAGAGTVNVVLSAAEIKAEEAITVFTSTSETVVLGTVVDENGTAVPCTKAGGVVTPKSAPSGTPVVPGDSHASTAATKEAAEAEVSVGVDPNAQADLATSGVSEDTYKSYFAPVATGEAGNWTVTVQMKPGVVAEIQPVLDEKVKSIDPAAATVSVSIVTEDVKPGLYYGIAVATQVSDVAGATPDEWKMATASGVELSAAKPDSPSGFYTLKCSPVDTNKKN